MEFLGESDVGNDDHVKRRRRILLDAGVTSGVVLVWAHTTILLPRLTACGLGDSSFRRSTGRRAGEVPSCQTENTAHDSEQNIELRVALRSGLEGVLAGLSLALSGGAGPSSKSRRRTDTRGGAEGGAGNDGGHDGG